MLSNEEMFQTLLRQMHWQSDDENIKQGSIEEVIVHQVSRCYQFNIRFPERLPFSAYQLFYAQLTNTFQAIAKVKLKVIISQVSTASDQEVSAYWPVILECLNLSDGMAQQVLYANPPKINQGKMFLYVENDPIREYVETNYVQAILDCYQRHGFDKLSLKVIVDQAKANERQEQYQSRRQALEKEEQEKAKLVQERSEQAPSNAKQVKSPDQIRIGRSIPSDQVQMMKSYTEEQRRAVMEGVVFDVEIRELRTGRCILVLKMSDYTSAFIVQKFSNSDADIAIFNSIKEGMWLRVRGDIQMDDRFARDLVVNARDLEAIEKEPRQDTMPEDQKRVELHLHTNMSALDATNSVTDFVKQAAAWGHKAIAVTDHGNVQAFPEASQAAKDTGVKLIYGMESYVVDDGVPIAYNPGHVELENATYVIFDVETTGLSAVYNTIIEIGAVKMHKGNVVGEFSEFLNPGHHLSSFTTELTGITDSMVANARPEPEVMQDFLDFCQGTILVAHNASFDVGFIDAAYQRNGLPTIENPVIDTLELARYLYPHLKSFRLNTLSKHFNVSLEHHHRAIYDATSTGALVWIFVKEAKESHDMVYHDQLNRDIGQGDAYKKGRPFHATILAKNQKGLKDLFKLVSASNVDYFHRVPRIPRSLLKEHREHLLIGSACSEGEVFTAAMQKGKETAKKFAEFYDYLEIQPKASYEPLLRNQDIINNEALENIINDLVDIGDELGIPVVATGDAHYLNPEDKIYREILINSIKSNRSKYFPRAHFRTTKEMLDDFAFLGEEKALELVVTNSNAIADTIEFVEPIHDKLYTPHIDGAEESIRNDAFTKAHEIYGENLPELIEERLERELDSIIGNGFAVIYYIAQKLVWKSNEDGYIVGSRGSVGSSFAATMLGITEVNPLPPHYVCLNCHYSHFYTHGEIGSGFDLEDKDCPECGQPLSKDGHDIPFETFLGFNGDKVPDIDLNFSGEYQAQAHNYTKVLFGEDHVYKAGTISTVADKTAFGYVLGYDRDHNLNLRQTEKDFLAKGATGVKRTTGQHPGGIIVIPENMDVYDFTPIQYPADEQTADWRTTHFDFHSIHDNVLKLDCLGHDDPTVIRKLQDLSGIEPTDIPMDDPEVYKLFNGTDSLGVSPEQIFSKTGTLGIPEFGTPFVRQMLEATHPSTFAELLQISGLSHGTDVWLGNAETLVSEKGMELKDVIGCRDDIMMDLIHMGVPKSDSFQIMEKVRKGKGLSPEHQAIMKEHEVPEWYMDSCQKIKYMFPKAHAAAYVINALRVAWFKVHHPIWYYCAYLSVRAEDFDLKAMAGGLESNKDRLKEIKAKGNDASAKEKSLQIVLELVNEMWERGLKFKMVDLEKSDAKDFVIEGDDTLIAPFRAVSGLGVSVAQQVVKAREESPFLSKEDLKIRGKVSQSVIDHLDECNALNGLPEENQLSLFDF
ncbi:PolC-type DNA polymerase III [Aerococcus mictus]|uniref:PolC-type DNA polymerase III n=1 Tax=Aerococcus mictus TaxID=2976810 RepID=UPI001248C735|nr:PolC-type DNA polymerase III [Aerococcus mictus]KAA9292600.1 PolC-type DNA polymerase III [Aerococcus mictus]